LSSSLRVVTGADWTHAASLPQLIASIRQFEPNAAVTIYDLGMTEAQRRRVSSQAPDARFKIFDYRAYPPYFDISVNAGEYAWKPTIVAAELAESDIPLCWMDAGNMLRHPLSRLKHDLRWRGFYARESPGCIPDWTHPGMLRYLGLPPGWGAGLRNLAGGLVGFSPHKKRARQLAEEWARLAAIRECIAPPGATRENHRQDQALLTALSYRSGIIRRPSSARWLFHGDEVLFHQDVSSDEEALAN
jgi:hypothetical protein